MILHSKRIRIHSVDMRCDVSKVRANVSTVRIVGGDGGGDG